MKCPTCGHEVYWANPVFWHCPTCGTSRHGVPPLVERVRGLVDRGEIEYDDIRECVYPPEEKS